MAFRDLVNTAKKTVTQRAQPQNLAGQSNPMDTSGESQASRTMVEKRDISYTDSEIQGFVPSQRTFGARNTTSNPAHGSIIKNIASQSNINQQSGGNATWQECRHLKKSDFGKDYCAEYHSLCAKDRCNRARK
jgi:hypothetical protein